MLSENRPWILVLLFKHVFILWSGIMGKHSRLSECEINRGPLIWKRWRQLICISFRLQQIQVSPERRRIIRTWSFYWKVLRDSERWPRAHRSTHLPGSHEFSCTSQAWKVIENTWYVHGIQQLLEMLPIHILLGLLISINKAKNVQSRQPDTNWPPQAALLIMVESKRNKFFI